MSMFLVITLIRTCFAISIIKNPSNLPSYAKTRYITWVIQVLCCLAAATTFAVFLAELTSEERKPLLT